MARSFGDEKMAKNFECVSVFHQTVSRRVDELNTHVFKKMVDTVRDCLYYSLVLDESIDITDKNQLLIFVRCISEDFCVTEELLQLHHMEDGTKGINIFVTVSDDVKNIGGFQKCSCVCTEGAKAMTGRKTGLAGLLRENGVNCVMFRCIIHQEALCGKIIKINDTMKTVVQIVSSLRGGNRAQRHRKFISFLKELHTEYTDVLDLEIFFLKEKRSYCFLKQKLLLTRTYL
ncbi:protein FAM200C-like [Diabrotica undecimpunctata]|uniref:protein FAM200C-like n=1 Tax=Diabrotica undecimpunctata TaxID=50387 RepID=UPI003B632EDC